MTARDVDEAQKQVIRNKVWRAIRAGRLIRPATCSRCGRNCRPHAHHPDYDRPLDVVWLCTGCHRLEHVPVTICTIEGCERQALNRGLCKPHYVRWWRHGDPLGSTPHRERAKLRPEGKVCTKCGLVKPPEAFAPHPRGLLGRQACCRECYKAIARQKKATS